MPESSQDQKKTPKYPKRLWLAGPAPYVAQETILVPKSHVRIKFVDGSALVHDAQQEAAVRKALGDKVFDETPGFSKAHRRSGWLTTSRDAFEAHTDVLEG